MASRIPPVKGTREFYPEQMALRNFIYENARAASQAFGYQEWDGPFIESLELYAAKSGEELVKKQAFTFTDRGGDLVTLRPELTPSLARMIAARQGELVFPLRWWSFGPFWRYEQPQKGRSREFFQWNVDLIGADSPEADAELIAVAVTFLRRVGLPAERTRILVNDRRLMSAQFQSLGIPEEQRMDVLTLIDRRPKMDPSKWEAYALEIGLTPDQIQQLNQLLADTELWKTSPELTRLFAALEALGVREYVTFDPSITRGLLYYTGTVFEGFDLSHSVRRAILGGGRYDNLLADVGGQPLPACGFAMGDVVIGIILQEAGLVPEFTPSPAPILVTLFDDDHRLHALALSSELRAAGLNVITYPEPARLPRQFKFADRMKIPLVLTLGPDELAQGTVALKDMRHGEQTQVPRAEIVQAVRSRLGL